MEWVSINIVNIEKEKSELEILSLKFSLIVFLLLVCYQYSI